MIPFSQKPVGVGVDLISWNRIKRLLREHPLKSVARLLSSKEQAGYETAPRPVEFFARCFVAKEAYLKASENLGFDEGRLRDIEISMEGNSRFRAKGSYRNDRHAEGNFFPTPDGIGAKLIR